MVAWAGPVDQVAHHPAGLAERHRDAVGLLDARGSPAVHLQRYRIFLAFPTPLSIDLFYASCGGRHAVPNVQQMCSNCNPVGAASSLTGLDKDRSTEQLDIDRLIS